MTGLRVKASLGLLGLWQAAHAADDEDAFEPKNTTNLLKAPGPVVPDQAMQTTAVDHDVKKLFRKERHLTNAALAERAGASAFSEPLLGPGNGGFGNIDAVHLVALLRHQEGRRHAVAAPEFKHPCGRLSKAFPFKPIKRFRHAGNIPLALASRPTRKTGRPQPAVFGVMIVHRPIHYLIHPVASAE